MKKIYIFTPTYNRKYQLRKLYNSLIKQVNKNFVWLIVDDGSTDGTDGFVEKIMLENKVVIEYLKKDNGGKHTAYNLAIDYMDINSFHVCVDSDDYLSEKAIEKFYDDIKIISNEEEYVGIVYPRMKEGENYQWLDKSIDKLNIPDLHYKYNLKIETCILINNSFLKGFRFKTFKNENFLSEGTMYIYLSKVGYFYPCDRKLYYFEYLEDGLTKNLFILWKNNIQGTLYSLDCSYDYVISNLSGIKKIYGIITTTMNKQALLLTKYSFFEVFNITDLRHKVLMPLSFLWKKIRFKE